LITHLVGKELNFKACIVASMHIVQQAVPKNP
jgi:hypothetical protein